MTIMMQGRPPELGCGACSECKGPTEALAPQAGSAAAQEGPRSLQGKVGSATYGFGTSRCNTGEEQSSEARREYDFSLKFYSWRVNCCEDGVTVFRQAGLKILDS